MSRLTKRIVEAAKPDAQRDVFLWDSELRGLGLRVKPNGKHPISQSQWPLSALYHRSVWPPDTR
ncbi:MAG TPA: hypothetical protein VF852_14120 [Pseudolabrys sp.]